MNCLKCQYVKTENNFVEGVHSYDETISCIYDKTCERWIGWHNIRGAIIPPSWGPILSRKPKYKEGDLLDAPLKEKTMLIHCCNDNGVMDAGIALTLCSYYSNVYTTYKASGYKLGTVSYVDVVNNLVIANMVGQQGIKKENQLLPPIRYVAIDKCLQDVARECQDRGIKKVIAPKFGAGLAGGDWEYIEHMINKRLLRKNINVTIYQL